MRKVAFLVGNDTFPEDPSIPSLLFPHNDAQKLAEVLKDQETCRFEAILYLNETSQKILSDLDEISRELAQEDTLLFYYSGHGKLSGNELCLVSKETRTARLRSTSIKASEVLGYLQESSARRRILVLDCWHSGAIANIYKGGDAESALSGLAHSYGTCILTASTAIQLAEEREKDGHGVFTKALIDCLHEPLKERITVDHWYNFAFNRLKISGNQTPRIRNYREGDPIEIGNFKAKHERLRRKEEEQLISTARVKLNALVASGALTEPRVNTVMRLLESNPTTLFPYEQERRDRFKRYLKGELDLFDAFGHIPVAEVPPEPQVADRPVMRPEPSAPLGRIRAGGSREGASGSGEPGKPKSLSRSVTLFGSAVLAGTVLFIFLGVVYTEKAGQFLHQALPNVSISGGMPAATPAKTPGVPPAAPAKTPAGPEVIEVQRGPAGSGKPEVLAAAEQAAEAARAKAAAESAAKEATAARATEAKLEAPVTLAQLVPDDIQQLLQHRGHALLIGVSDYTTGWDK